MARPVSDDFLHSMRFHVEVIDGSVAPTERLGAPEAGFSMCSVPEATVEPVEYKEGTYIYTRKQPGNTTFADISLSRGVAITDSAFWRWIKTVIEGAGNYREDVRIKHYHREEALPGSGDVTTNLTAIPTSVDAARTYEVFEAFPSRHKVAGDLDATASEISIMELDLAFEYFNLIINE
jgi:phage tail-like protein